MSDTPTTTSLEVMHHRSPVVDVQISDLEGRLDGRSVVWWKLEGGPHHGAINTPAGDAAASAVRMAAELRMPLVATLNTAGADVAEGVASLHAWGGIARAVVDASGAVPIILGLEGACLSGPALMLGLADHVVFTRSAFAYVSGPDQVRAVTGVTVDRPTLGGTDVHARGSGLATFVVEDEAHLLDGIAALLDYLPDDHLSDPVERPTDDPIDRECDAAAHAVPDNPRLAYDVREVVHDVLDHGSFLELHPAHARNIVVGYGRLGGRAVGVIANQPAQRAGTLDIDASRKGARFVQTCDSFNLPLLTFVDTPGYEPGRDLEWRGMIRHGASLAHAYANATVPRLSVILRKAYGGAYIVMDSRGIGNDWCAVWPGAEIAVMGAEAAARVLFGRELGAIADEAQRAERLRELEAQHHGQLAGSEVAAARGFVDEVIAPGDTRRALAAALEVLVTKRELLVSRRHANPPL